MAAEDQQVGTQKSSAIEDADDICGQRRQPVDASGNAEFCPSSELRRGHSHPRLQIFFSVHELAADSFGLARTRAQ
jgi:hypothetical protein